MVSGRLVRFRSFLLGCERTKPWMFSIHYFLKKKLFQIYFLIFLNYFNIIIILKCNLYHNPINLVVQFCICTQKHQFIWWMTEILQHLLYLQQCMFTTLLLVMTEITSFNTGKSEFKRLCANSPVQTVNPCCFCSHFFM
jgi:hypothetical protein